MLSICGVPFKIIEQVINTVSQTIALAKNPFYRSSD